MVSILLYFAELPKVDFVLYENLPNHRSISSVSYYQLFVPCDRADTGLERDKKEIKNNKKEIKDKLMVKPAL